MLTDFDIITRVVFPILTFVLGIGATFLAQRYWKNKETTLMSVKSLAELTADWYNQLDQLRNSLSNDVIRSDPIKAAVLVDAYIRNRLILPKMLYHLTVLREKHAYPDLVLRSEKFLSVVTSYRSEITHIECVKCGDLLSGKPSDPKAFDDFARILEGLDNNQQEIVREAARAIR